MVTLYTVQFFISPPDLYKVRLLPILVMGTTKTGYSIPLETPLFIDLSPSRSVNEPNAVLHLPSWSIPWHSNK